MFSSCLQILKLLLTWAPGIASDTLLVKYCPKMQQLVHSQFLSIHFPSKNQIFLWVTLSRQKNTGVGTQGGTENLLKYGDNDNKKLFSKILCFLRNIPELDLRLEKGYTSPFNQWTDGHLFWEKIRKKTEVQKQRTQLNLWNMWSLHSLHWL